MNDNDLNYATAQDPAAYVRAPVPPTPRELAAALVEWNGGWEPRLVVCGIPIYLSFDNNTELPSELAERLRRALEQLIREQRGTP